MMSSASKGIGERDAVVEDNISSHDDNDDTSASVETYEAARQLEESKNLLGSASDADVSNFSSSDSTQTIAEGDAHQKLKIESKLQRSPKHNFERMKFEEECKVNLHDADGDDESSDEKETKLCLIKDKKSRRKPKYDNMEIINSADGCSSELAQILKIGSKRTASDFEEQVDCRYSSSGSATISVQAINSSGTNIAENPSEIEIRKIISKKYPEKFKKTRLGSSEIAADVIEDAIDHTDNSVFVRSSDFLSLNIIPHTEIVTDITEDAIDNADQKVFMENPSDPVFTDVQNIIRDTGKVTDITKELSDKADETMSLQVKISDSVATADSSMLHKEMNRTSHEVTERTFQKIPQSTSQTLKFQEVISGEVFSANALTIFSQVSQIEAVNASDVTTETYNHQNIDIEKTESSIDSNPSDDRMEFSSASTIPSVIGYNTDIEKMDYSSDTYSGFESFKIDGESNATLEKMECKSESSTSRDQMETESLSMKSNETEGMEYSSDAMSSFEQKSISIHEITRVQSESTSFQENDLISLQESQSIKVEGNALISVHGNESTNAQAISSISFQEGESINVHEHESIGALENESISDRQGEYIDDQQIESINVEKKESLSVQEYESISVQESESISAQLNESIRNQQTESISLPENKSINILQQGDASTQILESVSSLIGDFVSRTIQETVSQQSHKLLSSILHEPTVTHKMTDSKYTISNESDSNSNEIKDIYESNSDPDKGIGRKFTIPRKEASDTEEYDYEQKPASFKEVVDKKPSGQGESSFKRRNSTENEKACKTTEVQTQSASPISELPDAGNDELKDGDDEKGHKKIKK